MQPKINMKETYSIVRKRHTKTQNKPMVTTPEKVFHECKDKAFFPNKFYKLRGTSKKLKFTQRRLKLSESPPKNKLCPE